jgi:signal peptidase II
VRRVVTGALEIERAEKRIGSSLEAAPVLHIADDTMRKLAQSVDFAEICIASDLTIADGEGPADAFRLPDVAGVAVVPRRAEGRKCARSWKISSLVGAAVRLTPFFDLVMAWNPGISYSLFRADSDAGRYALLAVQLAAIVFLSVWLWRAQSRLTGLGLGLIVGSALGNAWDRFAYGAVADFAHFHIGQFSWYIFNIADVGIVAGVALLLYESFFVRETPGAERA